MTNSKSIYNGLMKILITSVLRYIADNDLQMVYFSAFRLL